MAKPIFSPFLHPLVLAHQYQGKTNDCGPYSTAIVLNALLGLQLDGREIADRMNHPYWFLFIPIIRRIPNWATFPWGIVDIMRSFHLRAGWRMFATPVALVNSLMNDEVVMPIVGSWKPLWAHTAILAAYHTTMGWGLVNPANKSRKLQWLPNHDFLTAWSTLGRIVISISL